ncbi:hypothetical protein E2C01_043076 [Portunus trituberculatus]|uniref:Uncharacterized protein n=1 Tax=Portunus trituberculatus TaxID=210409 RepID=A0A5B7FWI5_PORTR|nr:hypothetical protein [Portunus trituberculatus]
MSPASHQVSGGRAPDAAVTGDDRRGKTRRDALLTPHTLTQSRLNANTSRLVRAGWVEAHTAPRASPPATEPPPTFLPRPYQFSPPRQPEQPPPLAPHSASQSMLALKYPAVSALFFRVLFCIALCHRSLHQ